MTLHCRKAGWMMVLVSAWIVGLGGCESPEPIREYTEDHRMPDALRSESRMLGAIVPHAGSNWFFKVRGPKPAVDAVAGEVREVVEQVQFEGDEPSFDLPAEWQRVSPGSGPFAPFAKYVLPAEGQTLDLTITRLGRQPDFDADVLANVNRWRGQMGLPPETARWAGAEPLRAGDSEAAGAVPVWVDLVAEDDADAASMMTPPMMSGGPPAAAPGAAPAAPPRSPPSPGARVPAGSSRLPLAYEVPDGWRELPAGGIRVASFEVGEENPVSIGVTWVGGDARAIVGMWASQVAGAAADNAMVDAVLEQAEEIQVAGRPAKRFYVAADGDDAEAIDVVVVEMETGVPLNIKMKGPVAGVQRQSGALEAFLASLRVEPAETTDEGPPAKVEETKSGPTEEAAAGEAEQAAAGEAEQAAAGEAEEAAAGEAEQADAGEAEQADAGEAEEAAAGEVEEADAGEVEEADAGEVEEADAGDAEEAPGQVEEAAAGKGDGRL